MLNVACPGCGERGKIPANLAGARIKCKKCGKAFQVSAAPEKQAARATPVHQGIAVEGLDAETWSLAPESSSQIPTFAPPEHHAEPPAAASLSSRRTSVTGNCWACGWAVTTRPSICTSRRNRRCSTN